MVLLALYHVARRRMRRCQLLLLGSVLVLEVLALLASCGVQRRGSASLTTFVATHCCLWSHACRTGQRPWKSQLGRARRVDRPNSYKEGRPGSGARMQFFSRSPQPLLHVFVHAEASVLTFGKCAVQATRS